MGQLAHQCTGVHPQGTRKQGKFHQFLGVYGGGFIANPIA